MPRVATEPPRRQQQHRADVEQTAVGPEQKLQRDRGIGDADAVADRHALGELGRDEEVVAGRQRAAERRSVVRGQQYRPCARRDRAANGEAAAVPVRAPGPQGAGNRGGGVLGDHGEPGEGPEPVCVARRGLGAAQPFVGQDERGPTRRVSIKGCRVGQRRRGDGPCDCHGAGADGRNPVVARDQPRQGDRGKPRQHAGRQQGRQIQREPIRCVVADAVTGSARVDFRLATGGAVTGIERAHVHVRQLAAGDPPYQVQARVRRDGQPRGPRRLVAVVVPVAKRLVARRRVVRVDLDRGVLDDRAGQGQARVLVPRRGSDEVRVRGQQGDEPRRELGRRRVACRHDPARCVTSSASLARESSADCASGDCASRCSIW